MNSGSVLIPDFTLVTAVTQEGCANRISNKLCELPTFISLKGVSTFGVGQPMCDSDSYHLTSPSPGSLLEVRTVVFPSCDYDCGGDQFRAARCSKPGKSLGDAIEGLWIHRYPHKATSLPWMPAHCPFPNAHGLINFATIYWMLTASGSKKKNMYSRCLCQCLGRHNGVRWWVGKFVEEE